MPSSENSKEQTLPPQEQSLPGQQHQMNPQPIDDDPDYVGSGKLKGKAAIITGGDSGIGRATAIAFAKEGADVAIVYLSEHKDAEETKRKVEEKGQRCLLIAGDVREESFCQDAVRQTREALGRLDVLVNNASEQHVHKELTEITAEEIRKTFETNVFGYFYMIMAAVPHLGEGSAIVNTVSITAYKGSPGLLPYSSTKGAEVALTRSLALLLVDRGIRVNGVAPGPVWTPLIPASFSAEKVSTFGADVPMKRPGQPAEIAPSYVFLASKDASYMTGQVLHPNGGTIIAS
ncbi:MAG: SDR family oxidoreductase [Armatimonadaceae bacterium]